MALFEKNNKWVWFAVAVVGIAIIEMRTKFFTAQYNKLMLDVAPKASLPAATKK